MADVGDLDGHIGEARRDLVEQDRARVKQRAEEGAALMDEQRQLELLGPGADAQEGVLSGRCSGRSGRS
jgi:hypothetical protein